MISDSIPKQTVQAAGGILFNPHKGFLLLAKKNNEWDFPKGRTEKTDADLFATARREIQEETGITELALLPDWKHEEHYVLNGIPKQVTYWLFLTIAEPRVSKEHKDAEWMTPEKSIVVQRHESRKAVLRSAVAYLRERKLLNHA